MDIYLPPATGYKDMDTTEKKLFVTIASSGEKGRYVI